MEENYYSSEIAFSQPVINIGSDGGNDIIIHGTAIADFHVMLNFDADRWFLTPLAPSASILVNGHGISPDGCEITSGMTVTIANYKLTVLLNGINSDFQIREESHEVSASAHPVTESAGGSILLSLTGPDSIELEAGGTVEYEATVTNAGSLVANMQLQLQGVPSSWVQIVPPVLNLNEGRKGTFNIRISPPRDAGASAGIYNLHFVAISPNYPRETGTANTALTILPYSEFLVTGMTPRTLKLSRRKTSDFTDLMVSNTSNADSTFMIRAADDANDLQFAYKHPDNTLVQGQDTVTVRSGDRVRVPIQVTALKCPLIGVNRVHHHYYANINPMDRPGDTQSVIGEVTVRPLINLFWLFIWIILLAVAVVFILQPRINQFDGLSGRRTDVIMTGDSIWIEWRTSSVASKVTLDDGSGPKEVSTRGSQLVTPGVTTTYTLTSTNFFRDLLNVFIHSGDYEQTLTVIVIPRRPTVDRFTADADAVKKGQSLKMSWVVPSDTEKASITENKVATQLTADTMSGTAEKTYDRDTLISLKAETGSSYDMKSLFVNVVDNQINLTRFTAWVRPNGIAIPENSDIYRATRWNLLQSNAPVQNIQTIKPASVNPLPEAQSNILEIPDNFSSAGTVSQKMNPEQQSLNGQTGGLNGSYQVVNSQMEGLLVAPAASATPVPFTQTVGTPIQVPTAVSSAVPSTSPEASVSNREFSVKLVEVVEDPLAENGYRVISYFNDYVLQKGEQVLIEWQVEGVPKVKIENLSTEELGASGSEYVYPDKSMNLLLNAQVESLQKVYSLPLRVAGQADEGEGSGLNCDLKANSTTLAVPGSIMLTWTGGGNNRVQLLSSIKAEEEMKEAEAKKEAAAKEAGQQYTRAESQAMSGGIIADYLEPAGFMRVDVNKQTTFVLNAYDGNNNVICSKSVDIKYTGGVDKLGIGFKIAEVADMNNISQKEYAVGQQVQVRVALSGYEKSKEPTGSFMVTDGYSTCSMTYPLMTCTLTAKHPGTMKLTAVYSGDDTYDKQTATGSMKVINKIETETVVFDAYKTGMDLANVLTRLTWDTANAYGRTPTGTITYTVGSSTCVLNMDTLRLDCGGFAEKPGDYYDISEMQITDQNAKTIRAKYSGDDYFFTSSSEPTSFITVETDLGLSNQIKMADGKINADLKLTWVDTPPDGQTPEGTIKLTSGSTSCTLSIASDPPKFTDGKCDGTVTVAADGTYQITGMNMGGETGDKLKAEYSGDGLFKNSSSDELAFNKFNTEMVVDIAYKPCDPKYANVFASLSWKKDDVPGLSPTGKITFTAGSSGGCELDLASQKLTCGSDLVTVTDKEETVDPGTPDEYKKGIYESMILKMLLDDKSSDRIDAKYSGDTLFNPSSSVKVLFRTIDTKTDAIDPVKQHSKADRLSLTSELIWDANDSVFTDIEKYFGTTYANDLKPTGTIKFVLANESPTWDILTQKLSKDTPTPPVVEKDSGSYKTIITDMLLDGTDADRVKAEYSGDAFFKSSESAVKPFSYKVKSTTIGLTNLKLSGGLVSTTADLSWDEDPAAGIKAGGTIQLTSGSSVCTLDISQTFPTFIGCTGDVTVVDEDPNDKTIHYEMKNIQFPGDLGTEIYADYSGDVNFLRSTSAPLIFSKFETAVDVLFAYKPHDVKYANVAARLSWNKTEVPNFTPEGTIVFTVGSGKCTLDVKNKTIGDCASDSVRIETKEETVNPGTADEYEEARYEILITKMLLDDSTSDRIRAEYSGDPHFNKSSSRNTLFATLDTQTSILSLAKILEDTANVNSMITWDYDSDAMQNVLKYFSDFYPNLRRFTPGGSIKISFMGQGGTPTGRSCTWDLVRSTWTGDCSTTQDPLYGWGNGGFQVPFYLLKFTDSDARFVRVEYSGDGFFNSSASVAVKFPDPITTSLNLTNQTKSTSGLVDVIMNLSWAEDAPQYSILGGTIKLTSGTSSCTLDLTSDPLKFTDCTGQVSLQGGNYNDKYAKYTITGLNFPGGSGDTLKAEYSGNYMYQASASDTVSFTKVSTELVITKAYKPDDVKHADVTAALTWDLEPAALRKPTGTVKFTVGSGSCTLDLTAGTADCDTGTISVTDTGTEYQITIPKMLLADQSADRIKAEYSGDAVFNPYTSTAVLFKTVATNISVIRAIKPDANHANIRAQLGWDTAEDEGLKPKGTVKFVIGSGSCTLDIAAQNMTCEPATGTVNDAHTVFEGWNMLIDDTTADRVSAEYSGDGFFKPSESTKVLFSYADTEVVITEAYKSSDGHVNLKTTLNWDNSTAEGEVPTGTLKITVGSSTVFYNLTTKELNPDKGSAEVDSGLHKFKFRNLEFENSADVTEIKVEYVGDGYYSSSSATSPFMKIPTQTLILTGFPGSNPLPGDPWFDVEVKEMAEAPNDEKLTGSLKLNVDYPGIVSLSCSAVINGPKATCEWAKFSVVEKSEAGQYRVFIEHFTFYPGLLINAQATYEGDSLFEASDSPVYYFNIFDTQLEITKAYQIPSGAKNLEFTLSAHSDTGLVRRGTAVISTDNGKSCSFSWVNHTNITENTCQTTGVEKSGNKWILKGMRFDPDVADEITVFYDGSSTDDYNSSMDSSGFIKNDTALSMMNITYGSGNWINMRVDLDYIREEMGVDSYPVGDLIIKNGSYTCTIPLPNKSSGYMQNLAEVSRDCGSGSIRYSGQGMGTNWTMIMDLYALPIAEPQATFTAEYTGDTANNPSNGSGQFENKLEAKLEGNYLPGDDTTQPGVLVTLSAVDSSSTRIPSGTVEVRLDNSGARCFVWISSGGSVDHSANCDGTPSFVSRTSNSVTFKYIPNSISSEDQYALLNYDGDTYYKFASGTIKLSRYPVTLTTEKIYSDGRSYVNVLNSDKKYPLYPAWRGQDYAYCNSAGAGSQNCRTPLHEFRITVNAELGTDAPDSLSGAVINISGGGISEQCSLSKVRDRVYSCTTPYLSFATPGIYTLNVSFDGNVTYEPASAEISNLYAISIPAAPMESVTVIDQPTESNTLVASAGQTVTVHANTKKKGDSTTAVPNAQYLYFTFNMNANRRIETCYGSSCDLTITSDTTHIFAEFVGNDQYAPSWGYKNVRLGGVTSGFQSSAAPASVQSPVSISVDLVP